jgi:membrane-associated phospholipid phosphatase
MTLTRVGHHLAARPGMPEDAPRFPTPERKLRRFLTPEHRGFAVLLSAALLIPLSLEFFDRALSSWSFAVLHRPDALEILTHIDDPVPPGAAILLALAGLAALGGWRPGVWGRVVIAAALAVLVSIPIKDELKYAFGRTWPETWVNNNPSWIGDGTYGFAPFHKGPGWASFPSGHMTVITAPIAVLWRAAPRFGMLWLTVPLLVAIGLIGADYHFLGDIIAGTYLGAACGIGVAALMRIERAA